jgi:hypothetical protein
MILRVEIKELFHLGCQNRVINSLAGAYGFFSFQIIDARNNAGFHDNHLV